MEENKYGNLNEPSAEKLYNAIKENFDYEDSIDEFKGKLMYSDKRRKLYDLIKDSFNNDYSYEDFEKKLGFGNVPSNTIDNSNVDSDVTKKPTRFNVSTFDDKPEEKSNPIALPNPDAYNPIPFSYEGRQKAVSTYQNMKKGQLPTPMESVNYMQEMPSLQWKYGDDKTREKLEIEEASKSILPQLDDIKQYSQSKVDEAIRNSSEQYDKRENNIGKIASSIYSSDTPNAAYDRRREDIMQDAYASNPQAFVALKAANEMETTINAFNTRNTDSTAKRVARGFKDGVFDADTWTMGISDARDKSVILNTIKRWENGEELTDDDTKLLDSVALQMAVDAYYGANLGKAYSVVGKGTAESLPFMLAIAATPVKGVADKLGNKIARYAINQGMDKWAQKLLSRTGKVLLGEAVEGAMYAGTAGLGFTARDYLNNRIGNVKFDKDDNGYYVFDSIENVNNPFKAAYKAIAGNAISYAAERLGNYGKPIKNSIAKRFESRGWKDMSNFLKGENKGKFFKVMGGLNNSLNINGILSEPLEEVYEDVLNAVFTEKWGEGKLKEAFSGEALLDDFLGTALLGGYGTAVSALSGISNVANGRKEYSEEEKAQIYYNKLNKELGSEAANRVLKGVYDFYNQKEVNKREGNSTDMYMGLSHIIGACNEEQRKTIYSFMENYGRAYGKQLAISGAADFAGRDIETSKLIDSLNESLVNQKWNIGYDFNEGDTSDMYLSDKGYTPYTKEEYFDKVNNNETVAENSIAEENNNQSQQENVATEELTKPSQEQASEQMQTPESQEQPNQNDNISDVDFFRQREKFDDVTFKLRKQTKDGKATDGNIPTPFVYAIRKQTKDGKVTEGFILNSTNQTKVNGEDKTVSSVGEVAIRDENGNLVIQSTAVPVKIKDGKISVNGYETIAIPANKFYSDYAKQVKAAEKKAEEDAKKAAQAAAAENKNTADANIDAAQAKIVADATPEQAKNLNDKLLKDYTDEEFEQSLSELKKKNGEYDFSKFSTQQLFEFNKRNFGEEDAVSSLRKNLAAKQAEIEDLNKKIETAIGADETSLKLAKKRIEGDVNDINVILGEYNIVPETNAEEKQNAENSIQEKEIVEEITNAPSIPSPQPISEEKVSDISETNVSDKQKKQKDTQKLKVKNDVKTEEVVNDVKEDAIKVPENINSSTENISTDKSIVSDEDVATKNNVQGESVAPKKDGSKKKLNRSLNSKINSYLSEYINETTNPGKFSVLSKLNEELMSNDIINKDRTNSLDNIVKLCDEMLSSETNENAISFWTFLKSICQSMLDESIADEGVSQSNESNVSDNKVNNIPDVKEVSESNAQNNKQEEPLSVRMDMSRKPLGTKYTDVSEYVGQYFFAVNKNDQDYKNIVLGKIKGVKKDKAQKLVNLIGEYLKIENLDGKTISGLKEILLQLENKSGINIPFSLSAVKKNSSEFDRKELENKVDGLEIKTDEDFQQAYELEKEIRSYQKFDKFGEDTTKLNEILTPLQQKMKKYQGLKKKRDLLSAEQNAKIEEKLALEAAAREEARLKKEESKASSSKPIESEEKPVEEEKVSDFPTIEDDEKWNKKTDKEKASEVKNLANEYYSLIGEEKKLDKEIKELEKDIEKEASSLLKFNEDNGRLRDYTSDDIDASEQIEELEYNFEMKYIDSIDSYLSEIDDIDILRKIREYYTNTKKDETATQDYRDYAKKVESKLISEINRRLDKNIPNNKKKLDSVTSPSLEKKREELEKKIEERDGLTDTKIDVLSEWRKKSPDAIGKQNALPVKSKFQIFTGKFSIATPRQLSTLTERIKKILPKEMRNKVRVVNENEIEEEIQKNGYVKFEKDSNGEYYVSGFFNNETGEVFINADRANVTTPIHEIGIHAVTSLDENCREAILQYGRNAADEFKQYVKDNYKELEEGTDDFYEEVAAHAFSKYAENPQLEYTDRNFFQKMLDAIKDFFSRVFKGKYADVSVFDNVKDMGNAEIEKELYNLVMSGKEIRRTIDETLVQTNENQVKIDAKYVKKAQESSDNFQFVSELVRYAPFEEGTISEWRDFFKIAGIPQSKIAKLLSHKKGSFLKKLSSEDIINIADKIYEENHPAYSNPEVKEVNNTLRRIATYAFDRESSLRPIMDDVRRNGGVINEDANYLLQSCGEQSRVKSRFDKFKKIYRERMINASAQIVKEFPEITPEEVGRYLIARHTAERNRWIVSNNILENILTKDSKYRDFVDIERIIEYYNAVINEQNIDSIPESMRIENPEVEMEVILSLNEYLDENNNNTINISGQTDAEAKEIVDSFESKVRESEIGDNLLNELIDSVDAATKETRNMLVEYDLESQRNVDIWNKYMPNYVPMRDWLEDSDRDNYTEARRFGERSYIEGSSKINPQVKKGTKGRTTEAADPIAMICVTYLDNLSAGVSNKSRLALLNMISDNPRLSNLMWADKVYDENGDMFDNNASKPKWLKRLSENDKKNVSKSGVVESEEDAEVYEENDDTKKSKKLIELGDDSQSKHSVLVYKNGVPVKMYFAGDNGRTFSKGMDRYVTLREWIRNNFTRDFSLRDKKYNTGNAVLKVIDFTSDWNRFMANTMTTFNFGFQIANQFRDIKHSWAQMNNDYNFSIANKTVANLATSAKENFTYLFTGKASKTFMNFLEDGGRISIAQMLNPAKENKSTLEEIVSRAKGKKNSKKVFEAISESSEALESITRFAAYKSIIDNGGSRAEATMAAHRVSVDLSHRGTQTVGSKLYVFFNAALQSGHQMVNTARNHPSKFAAMTSINIGLGFLSYFLHTAMIAALKDDDDDDKTYFGRVLDNFGNGKVLKDKSNPVEDIQDYETFANSIIPYGIDKNGQVKAMYIPQAFELRLYRFIGRQVARLIFGQISGKEFTDSISNASVDEFLPINSLNKVSGETSSNKLAAKVVSLSPTFFKPFASIWLNKNAFGNKIHNENTNKSIGKYQDAKYSTSPMNMVIARNLYKNTSGYINLYPENLDYLMSSFFGEAWQFAQYTSEKIGMTGAEEERYGHNHPIGRRFYRNNVDRDLYGRVNDIKKFIENPNENKQVLNDYFKDSLRYAEDIDIEKVTESSINIMKDAEKKRNAIVKECEESWRKANNQLRNDDLTDKQKESYEASARDAMEGIRTANFEFVDAFRKQILNNEELMEQFKK